MPYAHRKVNNKDTKMEEMKDKHDNEINDIKDEMAKLKETISLMQSKIMELNQERNSQPPTTDVQFWTNHRYFSGGTNMPSVWCTLPCSDLT